MDFEQAIQEKILILDGAMGTMVQSLDVTDATFGGSLFRMLTDLLTFARPEDLENIHLQYLKAGANLIETNTFGASPLRLKEFDWQQIDTSEMAGLPEGVSLKDGHLETIAHHLNVEACRLAKRAIVHYQDMPEYDGRPLFVAGSIGPSNYVLSSTQANLQKTTFDVVVDNNRVQVEGLIDGGADVLLFETQQDILELKASIIGAQRAFERKGKRLPIIAQVTVDGFSRMQIFNTDIHAAYTAVAGMGISVFGINCNVGPAEMETTVKHLSHFCRHPISIVPNAGQPVSEDGQTCYKLEPEAMGEIMEPFVKEYGVALVGGCCGTRPDHIRVLREKFKDAKPFARKTDPHVYISGPQEVAALDSAEGLVRIGEMLNVRGSKKVRDAVESDGGLQMEVLEEVAHSQVDDLGMEIIDVCLDSNIVETEKVLPEVIHGVTSDFKATMCIDSFSVEALEVGLKTYPGRPIVNSISLEEYEPGVSKLDAVLKMSREHCPVYIALVNGPEGPAITADEKFGLASEIVKQAQEKYGVTPDQILVDINAYPIGSESEEGMNFCLESLNSLPRIKAIHPDLKTSIGVGNLTAGLGQKPYMRKVLTSVFLDEARQRGLDCAILNPNHYVPVESLPPEDVDLARRIILQHDMEAFDRLEEVAVKKKTGAVAKKHDYADLSLEDSICMKIMDGAKEKSAGTLEKEGWSYDYKDKIVLQAAEVIDRHEPLTFISDYLMKTMKELGDGFGRGEVSLPHLLKSADVMRNVMGFLEAWMRHTSGVEPGAAIDYKGVVVIGTVYQDVHSIGKDLAKTLLENYGYRTVDLGVQVPLEKFVETAQAEKADAIGLSALLVQTSNHMITVARMLKEESLNIPILIGGAPVNDRHAGYVAMFGQDNLEEILANVFYCQSGMDGVNTMNALVDRERAPELLESNRDKLMRSYQRAKGMEEQKDQLLATLDRRKVSFKKHEVMHNGFGVHKVEFKLEKLANVIDSKSLFSLNWKFGKQSSWKKKGVTNEQLKALRDEWLKKADTERWITPRARFAVLPAQSEGDDLLIYDPSDLEKELGRIRWNPVIGKSKNGTKDVFSVAQYFHPKSSGIMDVVGLQITTAGSRMEEEIARFKNEHDSESALYLQGLGDRVAEDFAEYIHGLMGQRTGRKKDQLGQRYSPGYPALEDLANNRVICEILNTEDLGIRLTEANEFDPPSTTAAVVCFHPEASYF
ncbi:MAG: dihydropteroate synthase [Nitrospinaceae bacterium]|nr:dihydropteroate synthase [Nitrospinaceae bacterium]NIS86891.1 dihydropteroate synthase [Nitrospinaceae bacterium]NIT83727.1 dihydropteroate synthase [Nitrospinaceae bacterium]NIU45928.1 dihydropteroate synthase [Nitrospinaceae bacterium]NIU98088.1 dihydropteroate synthase [Nitrospinaceae bacterium]